MLSITSKGVPMESTTWSRPLPLSRSAWARVADAVADASIAALTALELAVQRWSLARRREREQAALRQLSPSVLRDIGAPPEWINEARDWRAQRERAYNALLRNL
jgi:hypothetical protein